jgi:hypothetical protein
MSLKNYIQEIEKKKYPFTWLQPDSLISFNRSLYFSIIYVIILSLSILGTHTIISIKELNKNYKSGLTLPFLGIIISLFILNKQFSSLIILTILFLSILVFSCSNKLLTNNYPNLFRKLCIFDQEESFMFLPFWMINLYLIGTGCILLLYELVKYYLPEKKRSKKKGNQTSS